MEGKKMVMTKIEAGKYSIVTASGLKFNAMKQRNHYWTVQNDSLGIIAGYPTLKECEEWAEKQTANKPAELVKPEEVTKADKSVKTEKADEPKSRVEKLMPDFMDGKIILNAPTHEARVLLMEEFVKNHLRWMASELVNYNDRFPNLCTCVRCEVGKIACESEAFYKNNYPLISIVTLTTADFDKPKKEFTKADLKTGMVIKCRNGARCLVLRGEMETTYYGKQELVLINNESFSIGTNCNDKLEGIDSVYKPKITGLEWMLECDKEDLIWQREPEYDWSKAEVDMPILGKPSPDSDTIKRHFAEYKDGIVYAWEDGATSFTAGKNGPWLQRMYNPMPYKGNEQLVEGENK
jgi:hypothetical protein